MELADIEELVEAAMEVRDDVAALRRSVRRNTALALVVAVVIIGGFLWVGNRTTVSACERSNELAAQMEGAFRTAISTSQTVRTREESAVLDRFLDDLGRQKDCGGWFGGR